MRIYLDTCVYNRLFDDRSRARVWLEGLALTVILQMIESEDIILVSSSVLAYENSRNPFPHRMKWVNDCLNLAGHTQSVDGKIRVRAEEMEYAGEEGSDPLGSTVAGEAEVDNFAVVREMLVVEKAEEDSSSPALEEGSRIGPEESSEAVVHIVVGRLE